MTDSFANWQEQNQRYLTAALGVVRQYLVHHASLLSNKGDPKIADSLSEVETALKSAETALASPSALEHICAAFGLTAFERDLLLLCAGMELDGAFAALCASAQGDPARPYPTLSLALAALPNAHWSAIAPNAPLRRWRLIEVRPGESLVTSQLRLDETVLHYLAGLPFQDERLQGIIEPLGHSEELAPAHLAIARDMAAIWSNKDQRAEMPFIQLCGDERGSTRGIVADACVALGLRMYCLPAEAIPVNASERDHLARLAERIAALGRGVLFVEAGEIDTVKSALIQRTTGRSCTWKWSGPNQLNSLNYGGDRSAHWLQN
jgi:hypothetical protein